MISRLRNFGLADTVELQMRVQGWVERIDASGGVVHAPSSSTRDRTQPWHVTETRRAALNNALKAADPDIYRDNLYPWWVAE